MSTLGEVNVNISGGLGLPLAGEDHITGLALYLNPTAYPSGILKKWITATAYLAGDVVEDDATQNLYTVQGDYTSDANIGLDVTAVDLVIISGASAIRNAKIKQVYANELTTYGFVEGGNADSSFYVLDKYFKKNPNGYLWVGIFSVTPATVDFAELLDMQLAASGKLRKCGIYGNGNSAAFALVHATSIQTQYTALTVAKTPCSFVYCPLVYGEVHGSMLDLRTTGNNKGVSVFNAFDSVVNDATKPGLGTHLGFWAISKVSESIGHVNQYNYYEDGDLDNFGFLDSSGVIKYEDMSSAQLDTLHTKAFCFLRKFTGYFGSYLNFHHTVSASNYDFNRVELTTTTDKASRNIRTYNIPNVNAEVVLNKDGTMRGSTIAIFQDASERALDPMVAASECGSYEVSIDPAQDVLTSNNVTITANMVVNGISMDITVNLTTVKSIS